MQTAIALLALSLGFANFNYVDRLKKHAPKNQEALFVYAADFVRKHKSSRIFSITEYTHESRCRSPPLLKFRVMVLPNFRRNINTLEADSEILITMLGAFAQAESESMSANIIWGKRQAMRDGKVTLQYRRLYGYRKGADGNPEIIPEQAEVVRRIYDQYLAGASFRQIKTSLEAGNIPQPEYSAEWTLDVIKGILTSEKYRGDALMQKTFIKDCISKKVVRNNGQLPMYLVQNNHPAIIDRHIHDAVQAEMARRNAGRSPSKKNASTGRTSYASRYALSERLVCGECGTLYRRCVWVKRGKRRVVWRCVSRLEH